MGHVKEFQVFLLCLEEITLNKLNFLALVGDINSQCLTIFLLRQGPLSYRIGACVEGLLEELSI